MNGRSVPQVNLALRKSLEQRAEVTERFRNSRQLLMSIEHLTIR
jgi:hypothetical protein